MSLTSPKPGEIWLADLGTFLQLRRLLEKELSRKVDLGFEDSMKPIVREKIKGRVIYV